MSGAKKVTDRNWKRVLIHSILLCIIAIAIGRQYNPDAKIPLFPDTSKYLRGAFNLERHGVLSMDWWTDPEPAPSAYILPGYPYFLSRILWTSESLRESDSIEEALDRSRPFILSQIFLLLLLAGGIGMITFVLTRKVLPAYVALLLTGFDPTLFGLANSILSEILTAFLLVLLSLLLLAAWRSGRIAAFLGAGAVLAALCMTRGVFQYLPYPAAILFLFSFRGEAGRRRERIAGLALLMLLPMLTVHGWKDRNEDHFGRAYMTGRGGVILDIRAEINDMTARQWVAACLHYSNSSLAHRFRDRFFDESDLARLSRNKNEPASLYQKARARRYELFETNDIPEADRIQMGEALAKIKAKPFRHISACIPFGIRGICIKPFWISLILFGGFFLVLIRALISRRGDILAALLPAAFSFSFYTFFSHNLPRYHEPILPLLYLGIIVGLFGLRKKSPT